MAMMFDRFEIQSELSKGGATSVYKATDTETNQTVALKTLDLESLGDRAQDFVDMLIAEGERTRELGGQNIALLYGAGEIEDQFCAAMEYVQGNSVATMLSRKEGFSIWDILDVTRQICAGVDYAASMGVVHQSLEPAKVMVQWDGLVKILGYGISSMSLIGQESGQGLGKLLPYCSPEQVEGGTLDVRSNLFTWGAVLYEMVTTRRAFDAEDSAALENQIVNEMPPSPASLNPKIHAGVSALIMKALAKKPEDRYQSGRELAAELEKCKEGGARSAAAAPVKKAPGVQPAISAEARAAAASKFVTARSAEETPRPEPARRPAPPPRVEAPLQPKVAAAAAGAGAVTGTGKTFEVHGGTQAIEEHSIEFESLSSSAASSAVAEPETETKSGSIAVDPIMGGAAPASSGRSFSDIDELPPMKERVIKAPTPPVEEEEPLVADVPVMAGLHRKEEKPKAYARESAEKALIEIKSVPPQLMIYSLVGAVVLILIVAVALYFHVRSQDEDTTAAPRPVAKATTPEPEPAPVAPAATQATPEPIQDPQPEVSVRQIERPAPNTRKKAPAAPVVVPGQIQIDSNPEGAQIQLDGDTDPSWITPFILTGLRPGQHTVGVSKAGFSGDTRMVDIASGSKSFVSLHLSPVNALLVVNSTPPGADVMIDGKSTGRVTPVQFAVEKGTHTVLVRKQGYLEETTSADLSPGQNFQFAPALRQLGNTDDIRTVGKFKKLFGGNGGSDSTAGMGSVAIRTQPKGAQIALNRRLLDKMSPVEVMVGPGNYILDITLTGYQPVHKVITVEKGGKVVIDEALARE